MNRVLLVLLALVSGVALSQGPTYTTGESWVTRYLSSGGNIKNITGLERPANWRTLAKWDNALPTEDLPSEFNWNDQFELQPIRNQKSCGSCWAFSVTAVTESLYWIYFAMDRKRMDLAEQTLVSTCSSSGDCGGGYFSAFNYIKDKGLPHEDDDPYLARNSMCKNELTPILKIKEWKYIGNSESGPTTEEIKSAIYNYGPVSVDVNGSFGDYRSGIYNNCNSARTNHMVTIEGWKDDSAFQANGGGYWIMRNSWGSSWGMAGYMNIVYKTRSGRNCNGIGNVAAYATLEGLPNLRQYINEKSKK